MSGWLEGVDDDWLGQPDDRQKKRDEKDREEPSSEAKPVVKYQTTECPRCGSGKTRIISCYKAKGRRYHVCRSCSCQFISEE